MPVLTFITFKNFEAVQYHSGSCITFRALNYKIRFHLNQKCKTDKQVVIKNDRVLL